MTRHGRLVIAILVNNPEMAESLIRKLNTIETEINYSKIEKFESFILFTSDTKYFYLYPRNVKKWKNTRVDQVIIYHGETLPKNIKLDILLSESVLSNDYRIVDINEIYKDWRL